MGDGEMEWREEVAVLNSPGVWREPGLGLELWRVESQRTGFSCEVWRGSGRCDPSFRLVQRSRCD